MGQFRIRVGHPREGAEIHLRRKAQQGIPDDDSRVIAGQVGELEPSGTVADGKDPPVGGAQPAVHPDAASVMCDTGRIKAEIGGVGTPTGRHQEMGSLEDEGLAVPVAGDRNPAGLSRHLPDGDVLEYLDAVVRHALLHDSGELGVVMGQKGTHVEDRHPTAQAAMGLGHLGTDRSAADDKQVFRQLLIVEQRLVGEQGHGIETGDGRNHRP